METGGLSPGSPAGNACAIPVPLGYWNWQWGGDAINTLNPLQTAYGPWVLCETACPQPTPPTFQPTAQYPVWTAMASKNCQ
jgi:hypothetical protein